MNGFLHQSRHAAGAAVRPVAPRRGPLADDRRGAPECPPPGEIVGEIGMMLVVHLAAALAVTLALRAFGIA